MYFFVLRCGICVLGETGLAEDAGRDSCGRCVAPGSVAADSPPPCGCGQEEQDECGVCRRKDSEDWNGKYQRRNYRSKIN